MSDDFNTPFREPTYAMSDVDDGNTNLIMSGIKELSPALAAFTRDIADRKYVYAVRRHDGEVIIYCESPETAHRIADRHDVTVRTERMSHEGTSHVRVGEDDEAILRDYGSLDESDIVDRQEREAVAAGVVCMSVFVGGIFLGMTFRRSLRRILSV